MPIFPGSVASLFSSLVTVSGKCNVRGMATLHEEAAIFIGTNIKNEIIFKKPPNALLVYVMAKACSMLVS